MVSIIILSYNNLKLTKLCIDSLLANTSQLKTPFEIIVVDNASKDGSVEYLKGLEKVGQIRGIYNPENVGYPRANNQAAAIAKGEYLCPLNNDVVLTEGWLEKLLRCIKSDSKLAAVGPYTSHSSGLQQSRYVYQFSNQDDLNKYSAKFSAEERYVDFLVFFCILIKRSVWDEIGGLDEDFGRGNYEDNLFCWRAIEKGYKLKIGNAYVYHFGGASFGYNRDEKKLKEYASLLAINQKRFLKKINRYQKISLCMIIGDFEKPEVIDRCLDSIIEWIDEIVVVFNYKRFKKPFFSNFMKKFKLKYSLDYGMGCSVKTTYIKWNNFSDMRNKSLEMASGDYILWLDCDDQMHTPQGIRDVILRNPDIDYFKCQVQSYKENGRPEMITQDRLFKNNPNYRFKNSAHEDISFSLVEHGAKRLHTNITINHLGNMSFKDVQRKNLRNMELLLKDFEAGKAHSLTYFGLVNCYLLTAKKEGFLKAIKLIDECFEKCNLTKEDPLTPKMWILRGGAAYMTWQLDRSPGSLEGAKQSFLKAWDEWKHPEAAICLAEILLIENNSDTALNVLTELYEQGGIKISNVPIDMKEIEIKMLAMMGDCYYLNYKKLSATEFTPENISGKEVCAKKTVQALQKAEEYYCKCLATSKDNLRVADKLIEILHITNRIDQAAFLTCKLINSFPKYSLGFFNMGQYELMNKRYITAEMFLKRAVQLNPKMKEATHNLAMVEAINRKRG